MSKHRGDRRDGTYLKNIDSMHTIMPLMYPNRCDNEAFISERIDLTNINAYLEKKNAGNPDYPYNLFQIMVTALLKVITLRPKMNRFIANQTMYQRNEVSAAFTVKKIFADEGGEALSFIHAKDSDTIDSIHDEIFRQVSLCRSEEKDPSIPCYRDFILDMCRSLGFASATSDQRPVQARFHYGTGTECLGPPETATRRFIMQKARRHIIKMLRPLVGAWFQGLFHSPHGGSFHLSLTVLVRYRSHGSI